jgi:pyruvyltransferase
VNRALRVFWCGGSRAGNFGDCLAPLLCEALAGRRVEYAEVLQADLVAVGSLLEPHFLNGADWDQYSGAIWGAGRMYGDRGRLRLTNTHVAALRGRLTRDLVIHPRAPDVPLGDPVLLVTCLARPVRKRFRLGLVPHQTEYDHPLVRHLADRTPAVTLIDIRSGVQEVLERICQCEFILASALHGLVAADALGIPNEWLRLDAAEDHFVRAPACRITLERGLHVRGQPPPQRKNTPQESRSANLSTGCPNLPLPTDSPWYGVAPSIPRPSSTRKA